MVNSRNVKFRFHCVAMEGPTFAHHTCPLLSLRNCKEIEEVKAEEYISKPQETTHTCNNYNLARIIRHSP
jgi:hypothetical protein